jgi:ribonucleoside-diphosphate reductase alpha chain
VNVSDITCQEDLNDRVTAAAFFGTLQAGFTDFHYLRDVWKMTTFRDALLGIGMTGIASGEVLKYNLEVAAAVAKKTNQLITEIIGTNEAARITCIKPSGTTSLVLGTASGIHAWHAPYYLRTMRFNKNEDLAQYLMINHPELCEDDVLRPTDTLCVRIPVKAPEDSILRTETAIDTLERVKRFSTEWVKAGHIDGANTHNVSATISVKEGEWETVGDWMWNEQEHYNGLSVLPAFDHTYKQAPFEDITEDEYNARINTLKAIDLNKVMEIDDNVEFSQVAACAGGACEIQ